MVPANKEMLPALHQPQQQQSDHFTLQVQDEEGNQSKTELRNARSQGRLSIVTPRESHEHSTIINGQRTQESLQKTEKELMKARYLHSQLVLSQRKREEMIGFILEENRKLRAEIDSLAKENQKKDTLIKTLQKKNEDEQHEKDNLWIKLKNLTAAKSIEGSIKNVISDPMRKLGTQFISQQPLQQTKTSLNSNDSPPVNVYQSQQTLQGSPSRKSLVSLKTLGILKRPVLVKNKTNNDKVMTFEDSAMYMRQPPGMRTGYLDKKDSNELSLFDYFGKSSVLRFSHEQIEEVLQSDKIKFLSRMIDSSEGFREEIMGCSDFKIEDYLLTFKAMINDIHRMSHLLLRLKTLLLSSYSISKNISLTEALEKIVDATCGTLECDRASVFMVDELTGELWTKVARGSDLTIRIPITAGIVGAVVSSNALENIEDAYKDTRFNKEVDKKNNYRTKTILCVPIRDQYGNVIGACQAINKLQQPRFTSDDEYIFETLALNAGIILRNQIQYDQSIVFQHKLRNLITIGTKLSGKNSVMDIMRATEKMLAETFRVDRAYIYLVDNDKKQILRYTDIGETKVFPMNAGLVGLAIQRKELLSIIDAYNHQAFNGMVDIDTSMPVLVKPIMASEKMNVEELKLAGESKKSTALALDQSGVKVLACLEVINKMGVVGRAARNRANVDPIDGEMLELFEKQFRAALITAKNLSESLIKE